jgi:outer membrane protein TolC
MAKTNLDYGKTSFLPTIDSRGSLSYSILDSRQKRFSGEVQEKNDAQSNALSANVNLNWTIFDGFAMFVNYSRLNEYTKLGELNTRQTIENLIARIGIEYFDYYQQKKRLQTLQYVLTLSKERLRISQEKYHIGSISKLDYQQDRIEFNADSSNYLRQIEALENARLNLINIMALPVDSPINITDTINVIYGLDYTTLKQETLASNTSLLIAAKNQILSEKELNVINSRFFPTLFLTGGYSFNKSESQAGIILENKQYGWNYGLGITYPIFNRLEVHRQRKIAKLSIDNAVLLREQIELAVVSDLNIIYNAYTNNIKVLELEKQNLETAHNNFVIAQERYRLGNLSGIEMREIQRMYLDAEDRLLNAQYQAKLAEISLKQISGRMEEYL